MSACLAELAIAAGVTWASCWNTWQRRAPIGCDRWDSGETASSRVWFAQRPVSQDLRLWPSSSESHTSHSEVRTAAARMTLRSELVYFHFNPYAWNYTLETLMSEQECMFKTSFLQFTWELGLTAQCPEPRSFPCPETSMTKSTWAASAAFLLADPSSFSREWPFFATKRYLFHGWHVLERNLR